MNRVEELEQKVGELREQVISLEQRIDSYSFEHPDYNLLVSQEKMLLSLGVDEVDDEEEEDDLGLVDPDRVQEHRRYLQACRDIRRLGRLLRELEAAEEALEEAEYEEYGNTEEDSDWHDVREQDRQPLDIAARVLKPEVMAEFRRLLESRWEYEVLDRWAQNHPRELMRLSVEDFRYLLMRVIDQAQREFEVQYRVRELRRNGMGIAEAMEVCGVDMRL